VKIGIVCAAGNGNLGDELFLLHWRRLFSGLAHVAQVFQNSDLAEFDRLIVGGGDLLDLQTQRPEFTCARYLQRPCWLYGVGCNWIDSPTPAAAAAAADFSRGCRGVYLRDTWSVAAMCALGGQVTGQVHDLLWAFELPAPAQPEASLALVRRDEYAISPQRRKGIAAAATANGMSVAELPRSALSPVDQAGDLSRYRVVVSTRIHFAIVALLYAVPVVLLYCRGKNRFSAIAAAAGLTTNSVEAALSADWLPTWDRVARLRSKAIEQQRRFVAEVLA
jgi:polysaccharide pyruvyl transferase WcaK-like protein